MDQSTNNTDTERPPPYTTIGCTASAQSQTEQLKASWVLRNRKRLAYDTAFINQAHQLHADKTTTPGLAAYPHALAIRLVERGAIQSETASIEEERTQSTSESAMAAEEKVETSPFV